MDNIHHLATGGTIDSHWDASQDTAIPNTVTVIPEYMNRVARVPTTGEQLFMKDSRQMTIPDRRLVAAKVAESKSPNVLVTSGTYLMPDIAHGIQRHPMARHFERMGKSVILTGSIVPMTGFLQSDGPFNLGMSVAVFRHDTGKRVLIVMNGNCFDADDVEKDLTSARFSSADGNDLLELPDFDLIPAGGSIDFVPDGVDGMMPDQNSSVPDFLRNSVKLNRSFKAATPWIKDSRELTDDDKDLLLTMVRDTTNEHVLITIGMYRIQEIQRLLREGLGRAEDEKKVVLTASKLPLRTSDRSDAQFNLGYAFGELAFVRPGVHVALYGDIVPEETDIIRTYYSEAEQRLLKKAGVIN